VAQAVEKLPSWASFALSFLLAGGAVVWWASWAGARLDYIERRVDDRIVSMDEEHKSIRDQLRYLDRSCERLNSEWPSKLASVDQRIENIESLVPRFLDVAPLIRDSNASQQQQILQLRHIQQQLLERKEEAQNGER
jgi:hypothetical protein